MKVVEPAWLDQDYAEHNAIFFLDNGIILNGRSSSPIMPCAATLAVLGIKVKAAYLDGQILLIQCQDTLSYNLILTNEFLVQNIKTFLSTTTQDMQRVLLRAIHWLSWDGTLQYCSQCGCKVQQVFDLTEKKCSACNLSFFPNLSPAIIVLIQRDNEILLARSPHFKPGVYSALAGFVDIGETAEAAAHREVKEEVGLEISALEYFGSQSWPFPSSFMIAFKAKFFAGEINIDGNEIEDARWFNIDNLPTPPSPASISRKLIDSFLFN
jgi:NAD+ diphosphatase